MLARLEHGGVLTTPLDEHGAWHRYHPLFAELLRAELRAQLPDEAPQLHRRAATWLAAHGDDAAALRHAAAGGAWDLAADLTTARWFHMMIDGEMGALRPILETMPRELVEASPELALAFGGALLARGDHAGAQPYLRRAEEGEALVPAEPPRRVRRQQGRDGPLRGPPARRSGRPRCSAARELLERDAVLESGALATRRAVLRPRPARHRRALDRRPRRRDRAPRAGPCGRPRREQTTGPRSPPRRISRWRAPSAARSCGRCATPTTRSRSPSAAAGRGRSRRAPPTACRRPWPSSGASARRPCGLVASAAAALHDTRDRPLRAVHALNRALLLTRRRRARGGARRPAGGARRGRRLAAARAAGRPAAGPGGAAARRGRASARRGARCSSAPSARPRRRSRSPTPSPGCACWRATRRGARCCSRRTSAPATGPPTDGVPLSVRAEAWLLDALALDALAEHDDAARSLERSLDLAEPAGLRRLIVEHGNRGRAAAAPPRAPRHGAPGDRRRGARHDRAPRRASGRGRSPRCCWPSR